MTMLRSSMLAAVVALFSMSGAHGQDKATRLTFDVASIKLSSPGLRGGGIKPQPGGTGYTAKNISVKLMISLMYKVPARQIAGGPEWLDSDNYDIEARTDRPYGIDDLHTMFQNLLADRFSLKFHMEINEGPVYALMVDQSGLKMKPDGRGQDLKIPVTYGPNGEAIGVKVPMQYLCWWLGQQLRQDGRPVIDKTALEGAFDFTLVFAPELPIDVPRENLSPELRDRPSLFDAVRAQLGLKLVPQKGPVENLVIDHIERPSEN